MIVRRNLSIRGCRPLEGSVCGRGSGLHPRQLQQHCPQYDDGTRFIQGVVSVSAFGRLDARRATLRAFACLDGRQRRTQPDDSLAITAFGEAGTTGVTVVDEYRGEPAFAYGSGEAADVSAVTTCDQWQQADRGVLGGV